MEGSKLDLTPLARVVLNDIDDVAPLSEADGMCIGELRGVLEKYCALDRFGVALLHGHFPVAEGEILVEFPDPASRTLVTRVMKEGALKDHTAIETLWHLGSRGATQKCVKTCVWDSDQGKHKKTGHLPMIDDSV